MHISGDLANVCIYSNNTEASRNAESILRNKFAEAGIDAGGNITDDTDLLVVIGGDGSMLSAIHEYDFPSVPVIGINTGHLGFFQELAPEDVELLLERYRQGKFSIQRSHAIRAKIYTDAGCETVDGMNEIVIRGPQSYSTHLDIYIGDSFIEKFSGDGILVASSAGSTAYNYSVGGAIVDPRINVLQVTPIAPMNTTAYRSFMSSVILPPDMQLNIDPEYKHDRVLYVMNDGFEHKFEGPSHITIEISDKEISLLRLEDYDFWNKVKTKFL
ncbi:MAG: NAD(+)/NADH kinase [Anaerovoracaceae bacterium]|nr:NAD(+)/NADH kinase [Anaerovoracaceae bacterium]